MVACDVVDLEGKQCICSSSPVYSTVTARSYANAFMGRNVEFRKNKISWYSGMVCV